MRKKAHCEICSAWYQGFGHGTEVERELLRLKSERSQIAYVLKSKMRVSDKIKVIEGVVGEMK